MTIKEFARLCGCSAQTLRYYDKIDLLKPVQVDAWTGYRRYDPAQAVTFVKIKNLQAADFTIQEIKGLLDQPDALVYAAFDEKIAQQTQKLARIREIQQSYLAEKNAMEKIVAGMTDYLLRQCTNLELLPEFGLQITDAPVILSLVKSYLSDQMAKELPQGEVSLTVNDRVFQGEDAVLEQIYALDSENLNDTIFLNTGTGHYTEQTAAPDPDFSGYDCMWEKTGWAHVSDFIDDLPRLQPGRTYCLWLRTSEPAHFDDLSFSLLLMGAVLYRQQPLNAAVNCSVTAAETGENHFKLLRKRE